MEIPDEKVQELLQCVASRSWSAPSHNLKKPIGAMQVRQRRALG